MCLVKRFPGFKVAEKDIQVYKILNKNYFFHTVYKAPYRCTPYILNKEYTSPLCDSGMSMTGDFTVEEGLHTFLYKNDAIRHCARGLSTWVVCEAVIPKGSNYAIGLHCDVVSDKLIVIREI